MSNSEAILAQSGFRSVSLVGSHCAGLSAPGHVSLDGYMLVEENGAELASQTARARPRRWPRILRVVVGEGRHDMDPWRYRERMGELNRETGGIWQPALVWPQRPAAGRAVGGSGEQGGG
jgi:hypothetical protein